MGVTGAAVRRSDGRIPGLCNDQIVVNSRRCAALRTILLNIATRSTCQRFTSSILRLVRSFVRLLPVSFLLSPVLLLFAKKKTEEKK